MKPWYKSRTLWALIIFVLLSVALWAQRSFLPEAPLPGWVDLAVQGLGVVALGYLRLVTEASIGRAAALPVPVGVRPGGPSTSPPSTAPVAAPVVSGAPPTPASSSPPEA